ncbi:MAG: hypothetical protein KJ050_08910 [Candidatus Omnitrophica bacterium]|nr:hypothetical protein [Candidatus Omnitrophota bacterium]NUP94192.1 hypothetical protein [Candidatus Omnitrophota bacterium]
MLRAETVGILAQTRNLLRGIFVLIGMGSILSPASSQPWQVAPSRPFTHGFVNTVYQSRSTNGEHDQDLYQYWDIETEELVPGRARGAFSLRLNTDIDGRTGYAPGRGTYMYDLDPFYSVDDARDREYADLFTGFVDLYDGSPADGYLRVGRQYLEEFDYIHADAITLRVPLTEWAKFTAFFGQAVSFYSGHDSDWTGGVALELQQSPGSRWLFEYHKYEDDIADNDSYGVETWQKLWEGAFFHAKFRGLDDQARDVTLNFSQYISPLDLTLLLDYQRLFSELEDESRHDSPLYRSGLCDWQPYNRFSARFDKALPCNIGLSGGVSVQRVSENEQSYGNRDYEHGDITLSFYPTDKWFYSISGEWWNTDPESSFFGYSGEIGYRPLKCVDWTVGSTYGNYVFRYEDERFGYLYREDPFVRTYYTGFRWKVNETNNLRVNFEYEDDDQDNDYYTLRCTWGQTF